MDRTIPDLTKYILGPPGSPMAGPFRTRSRLRAALIAGDRRSRSFKAGGDLAFGHAAPAATE